MNTIETIARFELYAAICLLVVSVVTLALVELSRRICCRMFKEFHEESNATIERVDELSRCIDAQSRRIDSIQRKGDLQ
jgi:hypothetical protein